MRRTLAAMLAGMGATARQAAPWAGMGITARRAAAWACLGMIASCRAEKLPPSETLFGRPVVDAAADTASPYASTDPTLPPGVNLTGDGASSVTGDPQSCADAAAAHTYVGCDYWPTVTGNSVWNVFDFAVAVANAGSSSANVTISRLEVDGSETPIQSAVVNPGALAKLYLPWDSALKGPDMDNCGEVVPLTTSVLERRGAYHLVSSTPVTVTQFNALEYKGVGGPPGKSWADCPGLATCALYNAPIGCFSFSNDASLLLPRTALTGNYRVAGHEGMLVTDDGGTQSSGGYLSITGLAEGTTVKVQVSPLGQIAAGDGIAAVGPGGLLTLTLNTGDVVELVGPGGADLSGSIVQASAPVEVITGHPCLDIPPTVSACDHVEESVPPAETLGNDYVVTRPTGAEGDAASYQVRFYGNFDNTHLTYNPTPPPNGCPTTLSAGEVVECGTPCPQSDDCGIIDQDFEVTGDQPFGVGMFTLGASLVDAIRSPGSQRGDPAETFVTPVAQFRADYVFLAPDDYDVSFADVVVPVGTSVVLDGRQTSEARQRVGSSNYEVLRLPLDSGQAGAHILMADHAVGIQVIGYGTNTSYMVPGGLNLQQIASAPPLR